MLSSGKLADANYQRIKYVTTSTTVTDAVACDDNANTEFHLLVKNGNSNKLFFKQFMLSSYYKIALLIIKSCMFFYGHILHFNLLHFFGAVTRIIIGCYYSVSRCSAWILYLDIQWNVLCERHWCFGSLRWQHFDDFQPYCLLHKNSLLR